METPLHNDDLNLASRLGKEGGVLPAGTDGVEGALSDLRNRYEGTPIDSRAGARMWAEVERATRAGSDRAPLRRVPVMRLVWGGMSIAAAILVLVLLPRLVAPAGGQLVASADAEVTRFTTADGSVVQLRPNSELYQLDEHAFRLDGEAFFQVVSNPNRTFSVEAGSALVEVLGTSFNVASEPGGTSVFLQEGRIRLSAAGAAVVLIPGESVTGNASGLGSVQAGSGQEYLDWLSGTLFFESRTAEQVALELARHFGLSIELPADVRNEPISGTLLLSDQQGALDDLGLVLGGRFVESGRGLRFVAD